MEQWGAIAAGHELSAQAGAEALADGGNAIDAAVAAVFAACTCEPTLTGPGGAGFATIRLADGTELVLDFFAAVPGLERTVDSAMGPVPVDVLFGATTQTFHVGPQSVAVPGMVAGVLGMHERFGKLPRARVLEYGIALARTGTRLSREQAYCHHLLERVVTRRPAGRAVFAPNGSMLVAGEHFAQPELADTLQLLADQGPDAFYRGDIARAIVAWSDANDGLLSRADLESYRVIDRAPVRSRWRRLHGITTPPPSSGGALVAYALQVLDCARGEDPIDPGSAVGVELLIGAMCAANAARGAEFDRHLYTGELHEWLLSETVVQRGVEIARSGPDGGGKHPSSRLGSTTHVSVLDSDGNAVAMTTSTGCGAGEFAGNTGIHLNNMLGEEDLVPVEHALHPGDRLTSMMAPTILTLDGRPVFATGSAGSSRLRSAILQTFVRALESRHTAPGASIHERLRSAVHTARVHLEDGTVHVEPGYEEGALGWLEQSGYHVNRWPDHNMYFGGVNMVAWDADAGFSACGDPRRGGGAWIVTADGSLLRP
jgi:gamma-glutamyltranspeptidase/glutathione hydrolase